MRVRHALRITLMTWSVVACLGGAMEGDAQPRATVPVCIGDPLYLDPSYYDAYYGYWTEIEAPTGEALA